MSAPRLPDYADWLTPERLTEEERLWGEVQAYRRYAGALRWLYREKGVRSAIELGCGTGWVPTVLEDLDFKYHGVDRNAGCLDLARTKNAAREWVTFEHAELRTMHPTTSGVVCAFAVLKHFRLEEWTPLFSQWFLGAGFAAFTVPIAKKPKDDGTEFTHTWVSPKMLAEALDKAHHVELWRDGDEVEPLIVTQHRSTL